MMQKMKKIILSSLTIFIIGCHIPKNYNKSLVVTEALKSECPKKYKKLKRHWAKHNSDNCYWVSRNFAAKEIDELLNSCLKDLTMEEVQKILGPPSKTTPANDSVEGKFDIYRYHISDHGNCSLPDRQIQFYVNPATDMINFIYRGI